MVSVRLFFVTLMASFMCSTFAVGGIVEDRALQMDMDMDTSAPTPSPSTLEMTMAPSAVEDRGVIDMETAAPTSNGDVTSAAASLSSRSLLAGAAVAAAAAAVGL